MSIGPIVSNGAAPLGLVAAAGQAPDPAAQRAQVTAQADLLQALRGVDLARTATAQLFDGKGIDITV